MKIRSRFKKPKIRNLKKIKKQRLQTFANRKKHILLLTPTPFYKEGFKRVCDEVPVRLLYYFLVENLKPNNFVPLGEIARILDIHRDSAWEWLDGLSKSGYKRGCIHRRFGIPLEIEGIREPFSNEKDWLENNTVNIQVQKYDPWIDRKYDKCFYDFWFPYFIDEVIDKYYDVSIDEMFMFTGERRLRSNGQVFKPLEIKRHSYDHPFYFYSEIEGNKEIKQTIKSHWPAPPFNRRGEISKRCNAGKRQIRKRISTEIKSKKEILGSWLPSDYFERIEKWHKARKVEDPFKNKSYL